MATASASSSSNDYKFTVSLLSNVIMGLRGLAILMAIGFSLKEFPESQTVYAVIGLIGGTVGPMALSIWVSRLLNKATRQGESAYNARVRQNRSHNAQAGGVGLVEAGLALMVTAVVIAGALTFFQRAQNAELFNRLAEMPLTIVKESTDYTAGLNNMESLNQHRSVFIPVQTGGAIKGLVCSLDQEWKRSLWLISYSNSKLSANKVKAPKDARPRIDQICDAALMVIAK